MATPKWVTDAITSGDVVTVTPQETFTLDLRIDEAYTLLHVMKAALPKLPEDDGWLIHQMIEDLESQLNAAEDN